MAHPTFCLHQLPADPLLQILSYVSYKDLVRCGQVCHRLAELAQCDFLWKRQCQVCWLVKECPEAFTWQEYFIEWYKDWGRYVQVYRHIKRAWNQIEDFMQKHCPELFHSIQDGIPESALDEIEARIKLPLPTDLRCSYRIHDGQSNSGASGLLGSMAISSHHRSESLIECRLAAEFVKNSGELMHSMPLAICFNSSSVQHIALSSEGGYQVGQVFYCTPDHTDEDESRLDNFITGTSFLEWLTTYADHLSQDAYPIIASQVFRYFHEPGCEAVTGYIKVTVATCFVPELSTIHPPHFFFTYRITMSMDPTAPADTSCQLMTRHWVITDEDGHEDRVDGPGVVGEHPIMKPGAEFSWVSCTHFKTTYGNMRGHFRMINLTSGIQSNVECPVFHMKCLPYQTSEDRRQRAMHRKKNL